MVHQQTGSGHLPDVIEAQYRFVADSVLFEEFHGFHNMFADDLVAGVFESWAKIDSDIKGTRLGSMQELLGFLQEVAWAGRNLSPEDWCVCWWAEQEGAEHDVPGLSDIRELNVLVGCKSNIIYLVYNERRASWFFLPTTTSIGCLRMKLFSSRSWHCQHWKKPHSGLLLL